VAQLSQETLQVAKSSVISIQNPAQAGFCFASYSYYNHQTMIEYIKERSYLCTLLAFSFFFLVFFVLYFSVGTLSSGDDHFFHFRFAEGMREHGLLQSFYDFKAIYFSKMAQGTEYFVYYNFLFYLVIIPFTFIQPLFLGIKLYGALAAALAFTALFWCLTKLSVRNPFVWSVILGAIAGHSLLWRFFTSRPFTLAPALLLLLLYFLHKKKYLGVFAISAVYLFWHSSTFFFPLFIMATYTVFEAFYGKSPDRNNILACVAGVVGAVGLAYALSPNFLLFMYDTVFGIYRETILGQVVAIPEGMELYKADFFDFIKVNSLLVGALIVSTVMFIFNYVNSKLSSEGDIVSESDGNKKVLLGTSFGLAICFFLGTIVLSRRFQDFFTFFSALFIALSWDSVSEYILVSNKVARRGVAAGLSVCLIYFFGANMLSIQAVISNSSSVESLRPVGEWLNDNVPKDGIVFNTSWNWFPQLYYHSPTHRYVIGLEPRFLYVYDPKLYFKWFHIGSDGYVCSVEKCSALTAAVDFAKRQKAFRATWYKKEGDEIADTIFKDFHSSYLITSKEMTNLNSILDNNTRFDKVFSSKETYFIYKIKPLS